MKTRSVVRLVFFLWSSIVLPAGADTVRVYVTNSAGDNIHVIDPGTQKVVQVIKGIEAPHGITFAPDGRHIYVSNEADSTLDVVNGKTGKLARKIPLSGHPNNIAITNDGSRVFVCIARGKGALDVVDTKSMTLSKTIPMNAPLHNTYVTPDGRYAVSGSIRGKFVDVVDVKTEQVAWETKLDLGVRPMTFETNPDGSTRRIYAQLSDFNGFAVIDFATQKEVARIKLPDEPGGYGVREQRLGSPSHGIGVAPNGKTLWVTSLMANAVFVYSLPDLQLQGHVALPEEKVRGRPNIAALPNWVTFTPDSKFIYVSNSGTRSVSAIDTKAMKVVVTIAVGEVPKRINTLALR